MKKLIEFQESNSNTPSLISRWTKPKNQFDDLILTPEYRDTKAKLLEGTSTLRVLPAIKDSEHWWLPIDALIYSGGQHAHPHNLQPNAKSVFDLARNWFKHHAPKVLYTKSAGKGFQLWTQPMAACWLIVTHDGRTNLKLLVASAFAGTTDRRPGLAYELMEFVQNHQQLLNPDARYAIEINRSLPEGSKYLETEFRIVESELTLNECIAELPSEQIGMVCPVEHTIRQIEKEEEWKLLEKAIGSPWTDKIRSSSQRKIT
jgi:hypothetical protein